MAAIFISHSSKDNGWAERIAAWLKDEQQQRSAEHRHDSLFLDFDPDDGIQLGERWRDTLYEKLQLCIAVIVICSEAYAASQWCLAELGIAMARGTLVLPVRIDASPLPKLLSETQATGLSVIDLEQGSPEGWKRLQNGLKPLSWQSRLPWPPPRDPDASPFPGLVCFKLCHAPVFFGQDAVLLKVQMALTLLTAAESRLLLILGASGCGKSSLLRAGVLPWLAEADRHRWIVLDPFCPEDNPFGWLAASVGKAYGSLDQPPPAEPARTASALHSQLQDLRRLHQQQEAKVVLAIDQFEEMLGFSGGKAGSAAAAEADAFLTMLAELLPLKNSRVVILATLRSDFLGFLQLHDSGLHRLAGRPILLGPMEVGGFRQVIEGPARRVGLRLETGLSDQLVADTATGDALPLLAFTLSELWRERPPAGGLTLKQYLDFGRLEGAVQKKADEVFDTCAPTEEETAALRGAFIDHLVRLDVEGQAAKQPARRSDLPQMSQRLVEKFVEARLLVSGKGKESDTIEVAHEALLRTWPTLVKWLEQGRLELEQRRWLKRLTEDLTRDLPSEEHMQPKGRSLMEKLDRDRRDALEKLAKTAVSDAEESESRALRQEADAALAKLVGNQEVLEQDRADAALVLALIGDENQLCKLMSDEETPARVRRSAAESLGLLASRCGDGDKRQRIAQELERQLRRQSLEVVVCQEVMELQASDWEQIDPVFPVLQGAARGLQLAMAAELPILGIGSGRVVPMLTLTALQGGWGLQVETRLKTEVVEVSVWRLPLPGGEQLELVVVPGGEYEIGSPKKEEGRDFYTHMKMCGDVDVEALRSVRLASFGMVRHQISQAQWRAVVDYTAEHIRADLKAAPSTHHPEDLWERYGQQGGLPVDSVSWNDCQQWLALANHWLREHWLSLGRAQTPQLALPSESQWEVACRAGSAKPFNFGDTLDATWANFDGGYTYPHGKARKGIKRRRPVSIGAFGLVNRWGLAEMHGQMAEWCGDHWHPDPNGKSWPSDGSSWEELDPGLADVPQEQASRLLRGGSWFDHPARARAACRDKAVPHNDADFFGVRPCCSLPPGFLLGP